MFSSTFRYGFSAFDMRVKDEIIDLNMFIFCEFIDVDFLYLMLFVL